MQRTKIKVPLTILVKETKKAQKIANKTNKAAQALLDLLRVRVRQKEPAALSRLYRLNSGPESFVIQVFQR